MIYYIYLKNIRRFCAKKAMPCHQKGSAAGEGEGDWLSVLKLPVAVLLVGSSDGELVTAACT